MYFEISRLRKGSVINGFLVYSFDFIRLDVYI